MRLQAVMAAAVLAAAATGCGGAKDSAEEGASFVFTAIPDQDVRRLEERFGAFADYLSERLDVPVRYVPVKSYSAAVTAFANDEVQLAWFGGFSGVQARQRVPGARAIAQGVEDPDFRSLLIAHHSTGLSPSETLPDALRGMTLTFGDKASTSGRLMPEFFLREHFDAAPTEVLDRVGYSGDHTRTLQLVASGAYDLGMLSYKVWESEQQRGNVDEKQVSVIWRSPGYPDYQWTVRGDVDERFGEGFTERLQTALLALEDERLLEHFSRSGFIAASNADYAPIADTARAIGLLEGGDE